MLSKHLHLVAIAAREDLRKLRNLLKFEMTRLVSDKLLRINRVKMKIENFPRGGNLLRIIFKSFNVSQTHHFTF